MKVFFLFLVLFLCLGCTNRKQEKAIQLRHELKIVPIFSAKFDSLLKEVETLSLHQQVDIYLEIASYKEFEPEEVQKQEMLLLKSLSFASNHDKKKILRQCIVISQKLDQLHVVNAAVEGLRRCEELENNYSLSQEERWELYNFKVIFLNQQERYKEGISILYNLLNEHREIGNAMLIIEDLCSIANMFARLQDWEKGLEVYKDAYQLSVDNKFLKQQVLCLQFIIYLSYNLGLYEEAILNYCNANSFLSLNASTYLKLSQCYLKLQKFDSARFYLAMMNEKLPKKNELMYSYKMADTYISENKEDSAAYYLNEAMGIIKERNQSNSNFSLPLYIMPVYASYASLLQKNGKLKQAGEAFRLVEPLMKDTVTESVWLKQKIESLYLYSSFCRATKQYEKATDLMVYRDSIFKIYNDAKSLRDAQNWVSRFEIQELTTTNELQKEKLEISIRINSSILVCAIVLGVGFLVAVSIAFYQFRQKKKLKTYYEDKLKEFTAPQDIAPQKREPPTPQKVLFMRAENIVTTQKLFLNASLTLDDLAKEMKTNRSSLSACINQCSGGNFNQWINTFRIQYAKKLIPQSNNLKNLAKAVGFGSYNTFSACFKGMTGYTPQEYQRMCKSDNLSDPDQDT